MDERRKVKIVLERHEDGWVAYPIGMKGVVVGQGNRADEALQDVRSAIRFHVETFGPNAIDFDDIGLKQHFRKRPMPDYDAGFKIVAREAGRELAQLGDVICDEWAPITGEVHAAERLADRAFRARRGTEGFIVYMEAYTRWEAKAPWSVLAKSGLLSERERLPCASLLYVLLPRGYHAQDGTFRLAVEGRPTQQIWFREICMWKLEPQPSWETSPGLMALSPLFHAHQSLESTVANAARCIKQYSSDRIREADLLTVLGLFGKLSRPEFDPFHVIGREAMKESKFYQEILEEGRQEGRRTAVLDALVVRFGKTSANPLNKQLQMVHDADDLADLLRGAIRCRTLGGFRKLLVQKTKAQTAL